MKVTFSGAAQTVTGSRHVLDINGQRLMLDCGLYQGPRKESYERNQTFPFKPSGIDAVILSHAHIDHSGNLPNLVKHGYKGPIYATKATAHLSDIMLQDAGHIQEMDVKFVNQKRKERGEAPVEPIYTQEDAIQVKQYFCAKEYEEPFQPVPGVTARLVEAGHILGSAAIVLDIDEQGRKYRLWFSGDIGRRHLPILRDPVLPSKADYLIMECTYGDKPHGDPQAGYIELRDTVRRTVQRGGKVIIPAFAVGRTQELVYDLHRMIDAGEIPSLPVYVDSPLAVNTSDIFIKHPECYDQETLDFIASEHGQAALAFKRLTYIRSVEESKALNKRTDPMVIISASGMAETGRILHHLRNNIEDPRNTILIVSWQAPYTLGRRLADREQQVKIYGETFNRKAEVVTIGGFSAHAGQDFLLEYSKAVKGVAKKIFLVHGEPKPAFALTELMKAAGLDQVEYPRLNDSYDLC